MKTTKQNLILFFGMAFIAMLSFFYLKLLSDAKDVIIINNLGAQAIPYLKSLIVPVTLAAGVIIMALSWNGRIERAFKVYFPINTIVLALFAWLLNTNSPLITNPNMLTFFYFWASISTILTFVMIWGFANQVYTFKTAAIQYPILGLIYYSLLNVFPLEIFYNGSNNQAGILGFAAIASFVIFASCLTLNRMNLGENEKGRLVPISYWVALGFIIVAAKMAVAMPELDFKLFVKSHFNNPHAFMEFMLQISISKTIWTLVTGLASLLMGYILYLKGLKALSAITALIITGMLLSGLSFYFTIQSGVISHATLIESTVGLPILMGLFTAFKVFKEFLFFGIDSKHRFSAKIAFDFMAVSFAPMISGFILSGKFSNSTLHALTFAALMAICLASVYLIKKETRTSQTAHS